MDSGTRSLTKIFLKNWRIPLQIFTKKTLCRQKLESMLNISAADSMVLPLLVFTQLFSNSTQKNLDVSAQKQNLT